MSERPPVRPLPDLIRENAVRLAMGAALAGGVWVWSEISALKDSLITQEARTAALREALEGRYSALRERTDASTLELARRIDRIENQNTQIAVHILEVMRSIARIEAQITAPPPPRPSGLDAPLRN
jgi:outer membrane murein-binding lipoprotein Lpp